MFKSDQHPLVSLAISPYGSHLAAGDTDQTVRVWDARSGRLVRTSTQHYNLILAIAFSPKADFLATAEVHDDQAVELFR